MFIGQCKNMGIEVKGVTEGMVDSSENEFDDSKTPQEETIIEDTNKEEESFKGGEK